MMKDKIDLIVILIIGLMIGYLVCYKLNLRTTDDQIEYVENMMRSVDIVMPEYFATNFNLNQLINIYFRYDFVSRYLLEKEIGNLCGVRPIKRIELNTTIDRNFCEELCP